MPLGIDLYSGAGGVTQGLKEADFVVVAAVDNDAVSCATYRTNHPEVLLLEKNILYVRPSQLRRQLGIKRGELDLLTACAPCQGFSLLGARNSNDPRNNLVLAVIPFVAAFLPKAVAFENVPKLVGDARFELFVSKLRRLGYGVSFSVIDAADFAVPQRRKRLVLLAEYGKLDADVVPLESTTNQKTLVRDAWKDLPRVDTSDPLHVSRITNQIVRNRIEAIPKDGGSRHALPDDLKLNCHVKLSTKGAGNIYGRMALSEVAPTLTTRCTTPSCGRFIHPTEDRPITLREAAMLQTFPNHYHFVGGRMAVERQIGNAVPVKLAKAIASRYAYVDRLEDPGLTVAR